MICENHTSTTSDAISYRVSKQQIEQIGLDCAVFYVPANAV